MKQKNNFGIQAMKKLLFGVLINLSFVINCICGANFFLQSPEEIKDIDCSRTIGMSWGGEKKRYTFVYQKDTGVYINITCKELPKKQEARSLFKKLDSSQENKDGFIYGYEYGIPPKESSSEEQGCYCVETRRIFKEKQDVENMSVEDLACFAKERPIIFYTGAGLSAAAGIFTMKQLMDALGMSNEEGLREKNAIYDPQGAAQVYKEFCESMLYNSPTKAHEDLAKIAKHKQCKIVTENLDVLHQRTGIKSYDIVGKEFKQNIKNEWAKEIEAIVCCGLSFDDKGFLGWYKKHNPEGVIIAIDLAIPNYLGKNDYLVKGNIQTIIPQVYAKLVSSTD